MSKKSEKKFLNYCKSNNLRVTPPRLSAYKILQNVKKPVTAYDVLELMGKDIKNPKPPTAYRALDFLRSHGFVHRIESLNAYVACSSSHKHKGSQFMICDVCGRVEEIHLCSLPGDLKNILETQKFCMQHWNTEVHGKCSECNDGASVICDDNCCN